VGAGLFLVLCTAIPSAVGAIVCITISVFFLAITQAPFLSMAPVFSLQHAGKIAGLYGFFGTVAGLLAPVLTGRIIDSTKSFDNAFYFGAVVAIAGALVLLLFCKVKEVEAP
jgi:nitrate/nitrite transporter NarK